MKELLQKSESFENSEASEHSETTEISEQTFPGDNTSISDMESELQTDQSVQGSPFDNSAGTLNKTGVFKCSVWKSFVLVSGL